MASQLLENPFSEITLTKEQLAAFVTWANVSAKTFPRSGPEFNAAMKAARQLRDQATDD